MNIVLNTNIVLVSVSKKSKYYWVFEKLMAGDYMLCLTTDILLEYEEIITNFLGKNVALNFLEMLENLSNVKYYEKYYNWNLIKNDPDDNKFVDCVVAADAKYIVSHDKHFKVLRDIEFPKIKVIDILSFKELI